MKKFFSLLLLLATICFTFTSCSDDSDEPDLGIRDNIIGTWVGTDVKYDGDWIDITKYPYNSRLGFSASFYDDGTYYGKGALGTGSGTYTIKGKTIETYVNGKLYLKYEVIDMTSTTAHLNIIDNNSSMEVKVVKTK